MKRREFLRVASGAAGATAAGASTTAAAQQTGTSTSTPTGTPGGGTGTPPGTGTGTGTAGGGGGGGGGSQTITLVDYAFEPGTDQPAYVSPGTTVEFVWETNTHNILVDSQPDGANWSGYEAIENAGFTYSHTFETTGEYVFHCGPHSNLGMEGTIVVNEQGAPPQQGGGGGPSVPDSAKTLGIATTVALGSTLGLAYAFLKYGGGRRPESPE